jgi:vacuolar-type H+-ATPase catalytic subunit A/Vma1
MPIQIKEASRTPNRLDQNKTTPRHIIIKTTTIQNRERILKAVREKKQITYKGKPIKITAYFSTGTLKARRAWSEGFWALKENNFNLRIFYPAKVSFNTDEAIKILQDKQKLKQYITTNPPLQKTLQDILHTEDESKQNHKWTGEDKESEKKIDSATHHQILK